MNSEPTSKRRSARREANRMKKKTREMDIDHEEVKSDDI